MWTVQTEIEKLSFQYFNSYDKIARNVFYPNEINE